MSKQLDKLKKQLLELSEPVNAFTSESVQLKVIDKILNNLTRLNKQEAEVELATLNEAGESERTSPFETVTEPIQITVVNKKPDATRILNQLLTTDYFDTPKTLPVITDHINTNFDSGIFYTYQVSGILLGLVKSNRLARTNHETGTGYSYVTTKAL